MVYIGNCIFILETSVNFNKNVMKTFSQYERFRIFFLWAISSLAWILFRLLSLQILVANNIFLFLNFNVKIMFIRNKEKYYKSWNAYRVIKIFKVYDLLTIKFCRVIFIIEWSLKFIFRWNYCVFYILILTPHNFAAARDIHAFDVLQSVLAENVICKDVKL